MGIDSQLLVILSTSNSDSKTLNLLHSVTTVANLLPSKHTIHTILL